MNVPKINLLVLFLALSPLLHAQSITDREAYEKLLVEQKMAENALLQNQVTAAVQEPRDRPESSMSDADADGMDDEWEINNGLDPADPKDALGDLDGDHIRNLFEFQLSTNALDPADPETLDLTPEDGIAAINQAMASAEDSLVVVRVSQGSYLGQAIHFFASSSRFMIQGGWNEDFTEHDPSLYPSVFFDDGEEPIYLGTTSATANLDIESHWVVEGVQLTALNNFSLSGALQCVFWGGNATVGILDVTSINNTFIGASLLPWAVNKEVDFRIFRSTFSNCERSGLYIQTTDGCHSRFFLDNVTIHNPMANNAGFDGLVIDEGSFQENFFTNVINWGNPVGTIGYNTFQPEETAFSFFNCDFDGIDTAYVIIDSLNVINADPLFTDVEASDFSLQANSPCIDTGVEVGLPFSGLAPDMGAIEFQSVCNNTNQITLVNACGPYEYQGTLYFSGIMVTDTFTAVGGCDSIVTLDLTVEISSVSVDVENNVLTATVSGDLPDYELQWFDCNSGINISGATGPIFSPTESGTYALRINSPNCQEETDCIEVVVSSLSSPADLRTVKLFPNPASTLVDIDLGGQIPQGRLVLRSINGQEIDNWSIENQARIQLRIDHIPAGQYVFQIIAPQGVSSLAFLKH